MDAGGQHIDECRWIGASVSKLKTRAGGEDWTAVARTNGDRETCALTVDRYANCLGCWWRVEAWTLVTGTMDAGGMDNGGRSRSKKATSPEKSVACASIYTIIYTIRNQKN